MLMQPSSELAKPKGHWKMTIACAFDCEASRSAHLEPTAVLLTKYVRKVAGGRAFRRRRPDQTGAANMAKGAAVATMSRAAMMRNQWTGNVARRAFMAKDFVLILILGK
ncbi:MAG: hypothetical protein AB7F74_02555 [Parvibaculaceae bacterium]